MKILIHGINFSPELTGIGKYTGELAQWLAKQGHEVRVVTAPPYYPQWQIASGYTNQWSCETALLSSAGRLTIYRCPLWVPKKLSGFKRLLHLASFTLSSLPIMLSQCIWRPEVVFVVEPPLFCAPQALWVAKWSGAIAWLHIQDYEVDAAFDLGILRGVWLRQLVLWGERWLLRRFDQVSTISQRMLARALAKGMPSEKVCLFSNWVDTQTIVPLPVCAKSGSDYRTELAISEQAIVALYSGNMGQKQGLEVLAQAASLLDKHSEVVFVLCGNGPGRSVLMDLCADLTNVRFLDLQPMARLNELLAMADIHLLPQRADAADLVMPSKLTGMLASGRPVVATARGDTELANVVASCGLVVEPEQPQAFAEAIQHLASKPEIRIDLGRAARVYAETHLDRAVVLRQFEVELLTVLGRDLE